MALPFYPEVSFLFFLSNTESHGKSLNHSLPASSNSLPPPIPPVPCYTHLAKYGTWLVLQFSFSFSKKLSATGENPTTTQIRATADSQLKTSARLSVSPLTFISSFLHCLQWLFQIFSIFFKTFSISQCLENNLVCSVNEKNKETVFFWPLQFSELTHTYI